jgi:hypothetical protein
MLVDPPVHIQREVGASDRPVGVVGSRDADKEVEPTRADEFLDAPEARLGAPALEPGNGGLGGADPLSQFGLGDPRSPPCFPNDRASAHEA